MKQINSKSVIFLNPYKLIIGNVNIPFPMQGEIRIRTLACGICKRELHVFTGRFSRNFPCVLGHEPIGIVESIGSGVKKVKVGDLVTGVGSQSFSEYSIMEERFTEKLNIQIYKPEYYIAEPVMCAVAAVNQVNIEPDDTVVICGTGFMGNILIQSIRQLAHPKRIIALDINKHALELAALAGADITILSDKQSFVSEKMIGGKAEIVFEASGAPMSISHMTNITRNGGSLCLFAHHFNIEHSIVNEWHCRGISVLNTVPWASSDLSRDLKIAVELLNREKISLHKLVSHTACYTDVGKIMRKAMNPLSNYRKGVLLFNC